MKKIHTLSNRLKGRTRGGVLFATTALGSAFGILGSAGAGSCVPGSCGSACGFKCIALPAIAVVAACWKRRKRERTKEPE